MPDSTPKRKIDSIHDVQKSTETLLKIGDRANDIHQTTTDQIISTDFHDMGIVIKGLGFIIIPALYLYCFFTKKPMPAYRENNLRWLQSTIIFALSLISVTIPVTGFAIGFVGAAIGLIGSIVLLTMMLVKKRKLNNELNELERAILVLQQQPNPHLALREELEEKKRQCLNALGELHAWQVAYRGFGFCLASAGLVGLIVAIHFPFIGGLIATITVIAAAAAVIARVAPVLIKLIKHWFKGETNSAGIIKKVDITADDNIRCSSDAKMATLMGAKLKPIADNAIVSPHPSNKISESPSNHFNDKEEDDDQDNDAPKFHPH